MGNTTNNNTNASSKSFRISNLTNVTTSNSSFIENKEDVTLIWLDKTIDITRTALREVTNYVVLYTELEPCIAYIRSINTERIFLIVSGSYAETCLDQIHDLPQINSIFIYCMNINKYKNQYLNSEEYSKIVNIFDNEDQLIKSIRKELNDLDRQLITFSLYTDQKSTRDLLKESACFLWFQLFKDILLQIPKSNQAKNEMIEQCKQFYRGNNDELRLIEEFERTYTKSDTIRWYTKQCFIYRLCSKALRTQDIELLYTFRYFIENLCQHLSTQSELFKKQQEEENEPIIKVYRGLKLSKDEIEQFQSNIESLISTNGFFSTTLNYDSALEFALKKSKHSLETLPTLFIIEADTRLDDVIFANISSLSIYPDEQEILFDINCAFKIHDVYFDENKNIWIVKLNLTNEGKHIIETYIEANKHEMEKDNILHIFGLLLIEIGQYDQAKIYFENSPLDDKPSIHTNMGRIKYLKGQYDEALEDFKIVYDLKRKETPKNDLDLARIMNYLGLVYIEQKKYDLAFNYLYDVIEIYKTNSNLDELLMANTNNAIGIIFSHKYNYEQALKYLFYARKLYEEYLPIINHPLMATNYNSIGLVFYYVKDYNQSLDYCLKSFHIREKVLTKNHPNLGDSYNNLALIHQQLHDYKQSLDLFQSSLIIYENNTNKKMNIPICLMNIGLLYMDQHDFDQAIHYYLKSLDYYIDQDKYQDEIGYILEYIGISYEMKNDFDQALKFYKRSLEYQEIHPNKFVQISMKIANIYQKNNDYNLALNYYQNALNKSDKIQSDLLANLFMSIGTIYHRQNKYESALDYYKRTLTIRKQLPSIYNLDLASTYHNISCLYVDRNHFKRALKCQDKAYNLRKKNLPSTHPELAVSLTNLGRIHQALAYKANGNVDEFQRALENYKAAFHIRRKSLSNSHPDLAISYYNLALIHYDQKEYEQSYVEIQKALNIQKKIFSSHHSDIQRTIKLEKQIKLMLDYYKK